MGMRGLGHTHSLSWVSEAPNCGRDIRLHLSSASTRLGQLRSQRADNKRMAATPSTMLGKSPLSAESARMLRDNSRLSVSSWGRQPQLEAARIILTRKSNQGFATRAEWLTRPTCSKSLLHWDFGTNVKVQIAIYKTSRCYTRFPTGQVESHLRSRV
jgi:hypothetical protein